METMPAAKYSEELLGRSFVRLLKRTAR